MGFWPPWLPLKGCTNDHDTQALPSNSHSIDTVKVSLIANKTSIRGCNFLKSLMTLRQRQRQQQQQRRKQTEQDDATARNESNIDAHRDDYVDDAGTDDDADAIVSVLTNFDDNDGFDDDEEEEEEEDDDTMTKETTTTMFDDSNDDVNKDTIIYYNADADKDDNYDVDDDAYNMTTTNPNFVILRQDKTNTFVPLRQDKTTTTNLNFDNTNKNTNMMNPTVMPLPHNETTNPTFMPLRQDNMNKNKNTMTLAVVSLWRNETTNPTFLSLRQNNTTTTNSNIVPLRQDKTKTFVPLRQDKTTTTNLNFVPLRQDNTNINTTTPTFVRPILDLFRDDPT